MRIRTFVAAALLATSAFVSVAPGGAPMGPSTAYLGEGQWSVGAEYGYEKADLKAFGTLSEVFNDDSVHPDFGDFKIKDLTSNMIFGTLAVGLNDNWDIFARAGAANGKDSLLGTFYDTGVSQTQGDFDGKFGFAGGAGTRATFLQAGPLSFGGLVQVTWFQPGKSSVSMADPGTIGETLTGDVKLQYWQTQVAVSAAYQADQFRFWAGPFLQFVRGDLKVENGVGSGIQSWSLDAKVQEKTQLGGHFGVLWQASDNFNAWVEGQITSDSWLVGVGAVFIPGKSQEL